MDLHDAIESAVQENGELPDFLAAEIFSLLSVSRFLVGRDNLLQLLLEQIETFDPYAGAGCFNEGSTVEGIRQTLALLGR